MLLAFKFVWKLHTMNTRTNQGSNSAPLIAKGYYNDEKMGLDTALVDSQSALKSADAALRLADQYLSEISTMKQGEDTGRLKTTRTDHKLTTIKEGGKEVVDSSKGAARGEAKLCDITIGATSTHPSRATPKGRVRRLYLEGNSCFETIEVTRCFPRKTCR